MVKKNNLFLTIKGKNHDGAQFISHALKREQNIFSLQKIIKDLKKKLLK